jgi:hypothetical protein
MSGCILFRRESSNYYPNCTIELRCYTPATHKQVVELWKLGLQNPFYVFRMET